METLDSASTVDSESSIDKLTAINGDIWTLIILKLHPKEAILLTMTVNQELRVFLSKKVKWLRLIQRDFKQFLRIEKQCREEYVAHHSLWPEYKLILKMKSPFKKYYALLREKHEVEFGMPAYGTCDYPQQLAERFDKYTGSVYMLSVLRINQPKEGGWRWHKWGEYCGDERPENLSGSYYPEYLREANGKRGNPLIDEAWIFNRHDDTRGQEYHFANGIATLVDRK